MTDPMGSETPLDSQKSNEFSSQTLPNPEPSTPAPQVTPIFQYQPFIPLGQPPQTRVFTYSPFLASQPTKPTHAISPPSLNQQPIIKTSQMSTIASPAPPRFSPQKRPNMHQVKVQQKPQTLPPTTSFNLDDPEELEKWKAERRKKFPKKTESPSSESVVAVSLKEEKTVELITEVEEEEEEDGALEKVPEKCQPSQRFCKYFSRGKCNKGDACPFQHTKPEKKAKLGVLNLISGKNTVFENLLKIEERDSLLKFHECIKLILANNK
jgi:hypothetical protein